MITAENVDAHAEIEGPYDYHPSLGEDQSTFAIRCLHCSKAEPFYGDQWSAASVAEAAREHAKRCAEQQKG